jgi:hypothetical protein
MEGFKNQNEGYDLFLKRRNPDQKSDKYKNKPVRTKLLRQGVTEKPDK